MGEADFATELQINAWTGKEDGNRSPVGAEALRWGSRRRRVPKKYLAGTDLDLRDWRDPRVGWGVLLPENEDISESARAEGQDAPACVRELLRDRAPAPVFRYRPEVPEGELRRYYTDRARENVSVLGKRGVRPGEFPHYLLIVGSPREIPWSIQYWLNLDCFVGRLDLEEAGLERYVAALRNDWRDAPVRRESPVIWSVMHNLSDITYQMRRAVAEPLRDEFENDTESKGKYAYLTDDDATVGKLLQALREKQPALVITTSHGETAPLDPTQTALLRGNLGRLVDRDEKSLDPQALLAGWDPYGAVWYAHACCSAGCDGEGRYEGLVAPGSAVAGILEAVAKAGPATAPLPRALLGAERPLRMFIGQVEPTFDWTLHTVTGKSLAQELTQSLHPRMYLRQPKTTGEAFERYFDQVGGLYRRLVSLGVQINNAVPGARTQSLDACLTAMDRESLVLLGDPTVTVPPLIAL